MKEKLRKLLLAAREIADRAAKEEREFTPEEKEQIEKLLADAAEIKKQLQKQKEDQALKDALLDFERELSGEPAPQPAQPGRKGSVGRRFVESPEFVNWIKAYGGHIPDSMKGIHSPPVRFKGLKDLVTGSDDTSAGAFVQTDYTGIYEPIGRYDRTVLDLVARRTTTSDLVEFVRQTTRVQQAAPVPEANVTTYSGATGEVEGEKPEAELAFEKVQATVRTIAAWIPATKRALADAAQIRGIIDQELRDDLYEELEDQILNGNGVGENFTGLINTAGILTQAWNTDILTTTRQAVTTLLTTGFTRATAWVVHPSDWETVELLQDANNRYYWGGPLARGAPQLWGVPVVQSQAQTQGTAILGDWRKAIIWDRESATISVSDSHADFFIRNMVAILAELRAAFGVIRPHGFIIVDMESGS